MSVDDVHLAPKVLLHDHLDGGVRPQSVIELAAEVGYDQLPETEALRAASGVMTAPMCSSMTLPPGTGIRVGEGMSSGTNPTLDPVPGALASSRAAVPWRR